MSCVFDASMMVAWLLPETSSQAAEDLVMQATGPLPIPSLFWHELRNTLIVAERRKRIAAGEATLALDRVRRLPLEDVGPGRDIAVVSLALQHGLTAYDAAYLALALERDLPLATLDWQLAAAARTERVKILGPLAT